MSFACVFMDKGMNHGQNGIVNIIGWQPTVSESSDRSQRKSAPAIGSKRRLPKLNQNGQYVKLLDSHLMRRV
jgi:hypothetical protein